MIAEERLISKIWSTIREVKSRTSLLLSDEYLWSKNWYCIIEIQDILVGQDCRLGAFSNEEIKTFLALLDLKSRNVGRNSDHHYTSVLAVEMWDVFDLAALCIFFERLGFDVDISALAQLQHNFLCSADQLTDEMWSLRFYGEQRKRLAPLTLSSDNSHEFPRKLQRYKTQSGYRVEYAAAENGDALFLTVRSPKFKKRKPTKLIKCAVCGFDYVKGDQESSLQHRKWHQRVASTLNPRPIAPVLKLGRTAESGIWVKTGAAAWKREQALRRATAFKREMGYDFVQWCENERDDPEAIAYLFIDSEKRIVGACCFRPNEPTSTRPWRMDWIWICPDRRRSGLLTKAWPILEKQLGTFDFTPPISNHMENFLGKIGHPALQNK